MKKIKCVSQAMAWVLFIYLGVHFALHIYVAALNVFSSSHLNFDSFQLSVLLSYTFVTMQSASPFLKTLVFISDILLNAAFITAGLHITYMLYRFGKGFILEAYNAILIQRAAIWLTAATLITPLHYMFVTYIASLSSPDKKAVIAASITNHDIEHILMSFGLLILSWILKEAATIQSDNRMVV